MMHHSSRRPVTLLEMLIAMGLLSILLTAVFSIYSQLSFMEIAARQEREKNFRVLYAQYRLSKVIPNILSQESLDNQKTAYPFYLDETPSPYHAGASFIFVFDNRVDGIPEFSNANLARLYVDREGRLSLASWPWKADPAEGIVPMRREILLEGVKEVALQFYAPPRRDDREKTIMTGDETLFGRWHEIWPLPMLAEDQEPGIPAIVRLGIVMLDPKAEPFTFTFVLPHCQETVLYTR